MSSTFGQLPIHWGIMSPEKGILHRLSKRIKIHVASQEFKNSTPQYPEKKKALEKLVNSIDENDNPVLMLVKLKH